MITTRRAVCFIVITSAMPTGVRRSRSLENKIVVIERVISKSGEYQVRVGECFSSETISLAGHRIGTWYP